MNTTQWIVVESWVESVGLYVTPVEISIELTRLWGSNIETDLSAYNCTHVVLALCIHKYVLCFSRGRFSFPREKELQIRVAIVYYPCSEWPTYLCVCFNTLRPRRNEQHFADDILKRIFFNENVWISIKISLKFVPKGLINNIPALVQIMAWRRSGDKPLSEPMMVSLPTHICVTRPQWVKCYKTQRHMK